MHISDKTGH